MNAALNLGLPMRARPLPADNCVDCWLMDLSGLALPAGADQDQRQALRLRRQFLLRLILGAYLQQPGKDIELVRGPSGKPALASALAGTGLSFNLSHTGHWLAVAVTQGLAIGIDIEQRRGLDRAAGLARRYFSPAEADAIEALSEPHRSQRFLELWTVREACIKAMGDSLAQSLRDLVLAPDSGDLRGVPAHWPAPAGWTLARPLLPETLHGCIAAPQSGLMVQTIWLDCSPR